MSACTFEHSLHMVDKDYEVLGRLGEGSFGKVYKAQDKRTGESVAVKQIKLGSRSWDEACRSTELQALRALRHPFIVRLRELIRSQRDGGLYYVFEFVDSDLCRLVKLHPNGLEELAAAELARQLFAGLAHMHNHNFFHRDLKPENILFDSARETIRIADLGQARSLRARPPFTDYVGTRWYRAPECLLRDRTYSSPVDIWASGLIVAELLRGSPLFCGASTVDQLHRIFQVLGRDLSDWPDFARLAQAMRFRSPGAGCGLQRFLPRISPLADACLTEVLMLNPRRRPRAGQCLEHAFFAHLQPLDIERLDTHRSRVSREPEDSAIRGRAASLVDGDDAEPANEALAGVAASSAVEAPDLDSLDAELDKILGDNSTPVSGRTSSQAVNGYFRQNEADDDASSVASLPADSAAAIAGSHVQLGATVDGLECSAMSETLITAAEKAMRATGGSSSPWGDSRPSAAVASVPMVPIPASASPPTLNLVPAVAASAYSDR